jgi:hypothetical protein
MNLRPAPIPKGLENVKIIDPLQPETITPKESFPKWTPPIRHPKLEFLFPKTTLQEHKLYQLTPIKLFDNTVKLHAGIDQACLLTKTQPVQGGLPEQVTQAANDIKINNQENLVQNYIRQALAFNPTKEDCVNYKVAHDIKFRISREFATPRQTQMTILLENLIRLCNISINKTYGATSSRATIFEGLPLISRFNPSLDDTIEIRRNHDFAMISKRLLAPVASASIIEETKNFNFVDMYPIFPTIDLKDEHIYDTTKPHLLGFESSQILKTNFVNTIFHVNNEELTSEMDAAKLIMFAFGTAYAQSQILLNNQTLEMVEGTQNLKKPIVVKAVSLTNERFNYVTYQLNTLSISDRQGIKNIVYYDLDNKLYMNRPTKDKLPYESNKNLQRYALAHLKYNPDAFKKLLSLMAYGASN